MTIYDITFLRAKIHQEYWWHNPKIKVKYRTTTMDEKSYQEAKREVDKILNEKKLVG